MQIVRRTKSGGAKSETCTNVMQLRSSYNAHPRLCYERNQREIVIRPWERKCTNRQLEERKAHGPHVRVVTVCLANNALRGHIVCGSNKCFAERSSGGQRLADSVVTDLGNTGGVHQKITRLDVAMNEMPRMEEHQATHQLCCELEMKNDEEESDSVFVCVM